jgi:hypothetical protein
MREGDTSTGQRGPTVVLLALLAFLGIKTFPLGQSTAPPAAAERPQVSGSPGAGETLAVGDSEVAPAFWRPLVDFHSTGAAKPVPIDGRVWPTFPDRPGWSLEFLIATVPDPTDSSSGHAFDPVVDAVQRAVEREGYVLARFFYPWPARKGHKGESRKEKIEDARWTLQAKWPAGLDEPLLVQLAADARPAPKRPLHERQPGVLVFRAPTKETEIIAQALASQATAQAAALVPSWPQAIVAMPIATMPPPGRLLVVLLVGETATGGIHTEALSVGLDLVSRSRSYTEARPDGTCRQIRIVGPYFSGSADSLARTLRDWSAAQAERDVTFREIGDILAGGAESVTVQFPGPATLVSRLALARQLKAALAPAAWAPLPSFRVVTGGAMAVDGARFSSTSRFKGGSAVAHVDFKATILPQTAVFDALLHFLHLLDDKHRLRDRVAFLCETNTTFGSVVAKRSLDKERRSGKDQDSGGVTPGSPRKKRSQHDLVIFPFSMRISDVRTAYEKAGEGLKATAIYLPTFGAKLRMPAEEREAHDMEPTLHPGMTAVTDERRLAAMVATIAHERFRYVAILASDIQDRIFLGTLVRQQCPNVRLLLLSGDSLLAHPAYNLHLKGALVGSTYPLYPRNQKWSFPFSQNEQRLFFSNQAEQGYYNATVALTGNPSGMLEYGMPLRDALDPPGPFPPVWISVIGQNGLQPLKAVDPCKYPGHAEHGASHVYRPRVTPTEAEPVFVPMHNMLWTAPFIALSVLVFAVGYALWKVLPDWSARTGPTPGGAGWNRLISYLRPREGSLRETQGRYVLTAVASVAVAYGYASAVCWIPARYRLGGEVGQAVQMPSFWHWLMPAGAALLLLGGLTGLTIRVCLEHREGLRRILRERGAGLAVGVCLIVPALALAVPFLWRYVNSLALAAIFAFGLLLCGSSVVLLRKGEGNGGRRWRVVRSWNEFRPRAVFVITGALCLVTAWYLLQQALQQEAEPPDPAARLFFFERATNLPNGLSPVAPVTLLGLAFFWWAVCQLRRLYLLEKASGNNLVAAGDSGPFHAMGQAHEPVKEALEAPHQLDWTGIAFLFWIVLFFTFCRLASRFVPTLEGPWFDGLLLCGLAVFTVLLVASLIQALGSWRRIRDLLLVIGELPLAPAYGRIPERIKRFFGPYLSSLPPDAGSLLGERCRQRDLVICAYAQVRDGLATEVELSAEQVKPLLKVPARHQVPSSSEGNRRDLLEELRAAARACLHVLAQFWSRRSIGETGGDQSPPKAGSEAAEPADARQERPPSAEPQGSASTDVRRWCKLAEDYLALEVINYVSQFFVQLRNQVTFLTVGSLLFAAVVLSYPFEPQRLWLLLATALVIAVLFVGLKIFIGMERDEVVSQIVGSTPNRVNFHWGFLSNLIMYTLPLVTVLLATSTDLADLLNAWLSPLFQVLR